MRNVMPRITPVRGEAMIQVQSDKLQNIRFLLVLHWEKDCIGLNTCVINSGVITWIFWKPNKIFGLQWKQKHAVANK
jgi:hypothetical protein